MPPNSQPSYQPPVPPTIPPVTPPTMPSAPPPTPQTEHKKTGLFIFLAILVITFVGSIVGIILMMSNDPSRTDSARDNYESCKLRGAEAEDAIFNFGHCDMNDVNAALASKELYSTTSPDLTVCAPDASLRSIDREAWLVAWGDCLTQQWATINDSAYLDPDIKLVDTLDASACRDDNVAEKAGAYCAMDSTIYMMRPVDNGMEYDLDTLFHEYTHALQVAYGVKLDRAFFVQELYKHRGDLQEVTETEAKAQTLRRNELNAICGAAAMFSRTGLDSNILRQGESLPGSYATHGGPHAQALALDRGLASNGAMSACNTWQWPLSEIDD